MKKLILLLIPCVALAQTGPVNVNTSNGHIKQTGQIGSTPAPFDFQDVSVINLPRDNPINSQLLSGGGVAWTGTGLIFRVSAANYLINGVQYHSPQTQLTLSTADVTDDRIDVFALTTSSTAVVVEGAPGGPPLEPQVDPATQLRLTSAYVPAGSSVPLITNVDIYLENTEWTTSTNSGNFNLASTNNPFAGTKDIEATAAAAANFVTLVKPSGTLNLADYANFVLQLRSKATWPNTKGISVTWLSGTTVVGTSVAIRNGTFGFDSSITSVYQQIVIPMPAFNTGTTTVDRVRLAVVGSGITIGFYIDNIIAQTGNAPPPTSGDFSTNVNVAVSGDFVQFSGITGKLGTDGGLSRSIDGTFAGNSDVLLPSQKAVKTYVDAQFAGGGGIVSDAAYNAGTWDAVTTIAPSKNAVRDKFESLTDPASLISDTAYNATSWDAVTTIAPSKNAVRDKFESLVIPADLSAIDFLVGTASGLLSGEIAVGTTPGGELGGTWASPTLDDSVTVATWTMTGAPGLTVSNGASTAGSIGFKEDSDNGSNTVTLIGPASTADVTVTLPAATDTLVGKETTDTLTNKRITKRSTSVINTTTWSIDTDSFDYADDVALTGTVTIDTTGAPAVGQTLWISLTGTAARSISWEGTDFEASTVALPTTTVSTNRLDIGFVWNPASSKWRCVASQ